MDNSIDWLINLVFKVIDMAREKQFSPWETGIAILCVLVGTAGFFYFKHKKSLKKNNISIPKGKNENRSAKKGNKKQENSNKKMTLAKTNQTSQIKKRVKADEKQSNNSTTSKKQNINETPKKKVQTKSEINKTIGAKGN